MYFEYGEKGIGIVRKYNRTLPEKLHRRTGWSQRWTQLEYLYARSQEEQL